METSVKSSGGKVNAQLSVIGRTPAGHSANFEVRSHERIDKVVRDFVDYFVERGELVDGNYGLALVRDTGSTTLDDSGRLDDYGIVDGDILALIPKGPQVDG